MKDDDEANQASKLVKISAALMARLERYLNEDPCNFRLLREAWMLGADSLELPVELCELFSGAPYDERLTEADKEFCKQFRITP